MDDSLLPAGISAVLQIPEDEASTALAQAEQNNPVALDALWKRIYQRAVLGNAAAQELTSPVLYFRNAAVAKYAPAVVEVVEEPSPAQSYRSSGQMLQLASPYAVAALSSVMVNGRRDRDRISAAKLLLELAGAAHREDMRAAAAGRWTGAASVRDRLAAIKARQM